MNDITALMATMKAAAERALQGKWEYEARAIWNTDENGWVQHMAAVDAGDDVSDEEHKQNMQFITTATPANVKTLAEALEAVDTLNKHLELAIRKAEGCGEALRRKTEAAERRIASLESRTVTVKLRDINEYLAVVHDKTLRHALRLTAEGVRAGDIAAMTAAGIQVI